MENCKFVHVWFAVIFVGCSKLSSPATVAVAPATKPAAIQLPPVPPALKLNTDLEQAICQEFRSDPEIALCQATLDEDDEYGDTVQLMLITNRKISKAAAQELAERLLRKAKEKLEPQSPPGATIGRSALKYGVAVMPKDQNSLTDFRAMGTKERDAESITWIDMDAVLNRNR